MQNASHTIREELYGIVTFIGVIWGVFVISWFIPSLDSFGVVPRTLGGLVFGASTAARAVSRSFVARQGVPGHTLAAAARMRVRLRPEP